MKTHSSLLFGLICCVLLAGCGQKQPTHIPLAQTPARDDLGYFCGMLIGEHQGPKSQLFLVGNDTPLWFTSVRDGIAFTLLPEEPGNVAALFVTTVDDADWDHPEQQLESWINADQAWYVIGSNKRGGMGAAEAIPFAKDSAAQRFSSKFGGKVVKLAAIPDDYILGNSAIETDANQLPRTSSHDI